MSEFPGNGNEVVCGKLFASWCHFCKELKQPWAKMLKQLKKHKVCVVKEVPVGDVQDEKKRNVILKALTDELHAKQPIAPQGGYPTIFKLDDVHNVVYFNGDRTADAMLEFFLGKPSLLKQQQKKQKKSNTTMRRRQRRSGGCGWWGPGYSRKKK
jgi:thiol-disulfide isomerase/thioredoxin